MPRCKEPISQEGEISINAHLISVPVRWNLLAADCISVPSLEAMADLHQPCSWSSYHANLVHCAIQWSWIHHQARTAWLFVTIRNCWSYQAVPWVLHCQDSKVFPLYHMQPMCWEVWPSLRVAQQLYWDQEPWKVFTFYHYVSRKYDLSTCNNSLSIH